MFIRKLEGYTDTRASPCGSAGKESACHSGDLGLIPGLGRSPGEGKGYPLQYSGLKNSMDCIVHGVAKSRKRLKRISTHTIYLIFVEHILGTNSILVIL